MPPKGTTKESKKVSPNLEEARERINNGTFHDVFSKEYSGVRKFSKFMRAKRKFKTEKLRRKITV